MHTIVIDVPEDIVEHYTTIDEVKRILVEDFVASEYEKGDISIRQGAKMLGLTYEEFMVEFLGSRKISFINGTPEELQLERQQEETWLDEALGDNI